MPRRLLRSAARTAGRTALIAGTATAVSGGVARRQHERALRQHAAPAAANAQPSNENSDLVVRLQVLADLRAAGSLSDQEFKAAKAKLLA